MLQVTYLAYDGCKYSGILALQDTFEIADFWAKTLLKHQYKPIFSSRVVTVTGDPVQTDKNILIQPDLPLSKATQSRIIVIPAYLPQVTSMPDNINKITHWLNREYQSKAYIATLCTGSFLLASSGLLNGKKATTNWQYTRAFKKNYPEVELIPEKMITEDRRLICSGSATALFSLGLHLIEKFGSPELAALTSKSMLIDPNRTSQMPYTVFDLNRHHQDDNIAKTQHWMEANHAAPITIENAADYSGISSRHFKRRFKQATGETPLVYLQKIRVESAKKLLEKTDMNINEITIKVGYEDASTFRRMFKKYVSLSPREYRDKFSSA